MRCSTWHPAAVMWQWKFARLAGKKLSLRPSSCTRCGHLHLACSRVQISFSLTADKCQPSPVQQLKYLRTYLDELLQEAGPAKAR